MGDDGDRRLCTRLEYRLFAVVAVVGVAWNAWCATGYATDGDWLYSARHAAPLVMGAGIAFAWRRAERAEARGGE